jgi:hypothetical protein
MKVFCISALSITGALAGLCLLALPFWLMGVPGTENSYAKGWKLGLRTIVVYPIGWFCLFAYWRKSRPHLGGEKLADLNLWVGIGSLGLLALAGGVVLYSFRVMSRR